MALGQRSALGLAVMGDGFVMGDGGIAQHHRVSSVVGKAFGRVRWEEDFCKKTFWA